MALKICRQLGQQFKIGNVVFTVAKITGPDTFVLERRAGMIQQTQIEARPIELLPNVKVSAGKSDRPHRAWITIDAPRDVRIERIPVDTDEFAE